MAQTKGGLSRFDMHTASVSFDLSDTLAVLFPVWQLPHFSLQYCFMGSYRTQHTYASRAVKKGVAPEILQKIFGHAGYSTTANVYTHIDIKTLVQAVDVSGLQTGY